MSGRGENVDLFVSYAHADDTDGWVTVLVAVIKEIQQGFGPAEPWRVFFDTHAIRTMDDWEKRIRTGVRSAGVMLALLSPAYFRSEWCRREWEEFHRQEEQRGEPRNRIAVLYLQTDPSYEGPAAGADWQQDLRRRQHLDLRTWRCGGQDALSADADGQAQLRRSDGLGVVGPGRAGGGGGGAGVPVGRGAAAAGRGGAGGRQGVAGVPGT
jgi:hypothetical protein